jgi:hypothetical protein
MKTTAIFFVAMLLFLIPRICDAQCPTDPVPCVNPVVPHLVKYSGALKEAAVSHSVVVSLKFVIYGNATGGTPLWQEIQNAQVDSQGHYEVMLGATANDGIPIELFTSGESRWLGVQVLAPGELEQPRVLMVSVPYALEASDAQTLGGLPASAFAKVTSSSSSAEIASTTVPSSAAATSTAASASGTNAPVTALLPTPPVSTVHTVNTVPKFAAAGGLIDSQITDANGVVGMRNLDNTIFADVYPNGVPDAVAACPASGCIIYAASPNVNLNLGTIDPGTKAITIYLGPYVYTVNQITLRKSLKIIGMGASGGANGSVTCSVALPCNGTSLQSTNANVPIFVLPQTNNQPATNVRLSGFRVLGAAGNTGQDGFFLDTSSTSNTGLWYSTLDDIYLQGFAGIGIHVKGRSNDFLSGTQWVFFNNVVVFRTAGGKNALRVEGASFELRFVNCQFDGSGIGDGTNIYIGGISRGTNGYPTSLVFEGLVSQSAALAVQLDGLVNVTFYGSHHEALFGTFQITNNTNIGTQGVTISDGYFAGNVGINGGSGFDLNVGTTLASGIVFTHNQIFGTPDAVITGTNLASVVYQDNFYLGTQNLPPTSGITSQLTPAAAINTRGVHSVGLNSSSTPITTIQSSLGPGEMITFFMLSGSAIFAAGGNIDLLGAGPVTVTGTITFVRSDLGAPLWKPVAQWTPPAPPAPTPTHATKVARANKGVDSSRN